MAVQLMVNTNVTPTVTVNAQTGTSYTFTLSDANSTLITASNASANTFTIPPNYSVAFPIGSVLNIISIGAGQTTLAAGSGVTIQSYGATASAPKLRTQYSAATAIQISANTWVVSGDIA
jgi:hypothetical protein